MFRPWPDFLGAFGYSAYGPAKYAVRGFSDVLRLEVKPLGMRVSVVFPPDMDTPGMANENKTKPFETFAAASARKAASAATGGEGHPERGCGAGSTSSCRAWIRRSYIA